MENLAFFDAIGLKLSWIWP